MSHQRPVRRSRQQLIVSIASGVLMLLAGAWALLNQGQQVAPTQTLAAPTIASTRQVSSRATSTPAKATIPRESGLPSIAASKLPPEARITLVLIAQGGPFPHKRDGVIFENREGLLPRKPSGYYHEYTVETPGSNDRGARRIVIGQRGERYYSDDHYASFSEVQP
jgi:ribonuclease T1